MSSELFTLSGWEPDADNRYSLSLLLQKLPHRLPMKYIAGRSSGLQLFYQRTGVWKASYQGVCATHGDTPEDAAYELCCELIRQGILKS